MDSVQQQFNYIQSQLSALTAKVGEITNDLEREREFRTEIRAALGYFRDDITDLRALGPKTHEALQKAEKHDGRLETLETWRNQMIGAKRATHAIAGGIGGSLVIGVEWLYHFVTMTSHR